MSQSNDISKNISNLTKSIEDLGKIVNKGVPEIDIEKSFLSKEEIMVKTLMNGGDIESYDSSDNKSSSLSEEEAYEMVHGELQYDEKGELLYPGKVNKEKTKIDDNHPFHVKINKMKEDVKISLKQLSIKGVEITSASSQLGIEVVASSATIISSAAILPTGSGLPVAFSSLLSMMSSLQSYQTKVTQIIPLLKPLSNLSLLVSPVKGGDVSVLNVVNKSLVSMRKNIDASKVISKVIMSLVPNLPKPPGVGGESPEKIELKLGADNRIIKKGESTNLYAEASKGKWEYTYDWIDSNGWDHISTSRKVEIKPSKTTRYHCEVKNSDGTGLVSKYIDINVK